MNNDSYLDYDIDAELQRMSRDELLTWYSDIYKEKEGIRPHDVTSDVTDEELRDKIKDVASWPVLQDPFEESVRLLKSVIKEEVKRIISK